MTIFGNRDSGYGSTPTAGAQPTLDRFDAPVVTSSRAFGAPDTRRVILRVHGDENIVVGSAEGRDNAVRIARNMVQHIEQAAAKGERTGPVVASATTCPPSIVGTIVVTASIIIWT